MRNLALALFAATLLATLAFALGDALYAGQWLLAALLGAGLAAGLFIISPRTSVHPSPPDAAEDNALATGAGR